MTPLVATVIVFALLVGAFVLCKSWLGKQSDMLLARYHALGILIWAMAAINLTALLLQWLAPGSAPTGPLGLFLVSMLLYVLWQRQRFARQLRER